VHEKELYASLCGTVLKVAAPLKKSEVPVQPKSLKIKLVKDNWLLYPSQEKITKWNVCMQCPYTKKLHCLSENIWRELTTSFQKALDPLKLTREKMF
jgi:hypothetical protein